MYIIDRNRNHSNYYSENVKLRLVCEFSEQYFYHPQDTSSRLSHFLSPTPYCFDSCKTKVSNLHRAIIMKEDVFRKQVKAKHKIDYITVSHECTCTTSTKTLSELATIDQVCVHCSFSPKDMVYLHAKVHNCVIIGLKYNIQTLAVF